MCKRHATGIAASLALLAQEGATLAQSPDVASANVMMPGCRNFLLDDPPATYMTGLCTGIVQTLFIFSRSRVGICIPNGANLGQAVRVIILYIEQRPARMHERFDVLALEALQQAWPCRR